MQFLSTSTPASKLNKPTMSEVMVLILSKSRIFLSAVLRLVQVWKERSSQRRELLQLSTSLLKDIGVSREDAINEASKPFWKK
tara:strand:+ start:143 stop:391 length:249 start_codon:yes stop_codon:yes gene_type:complete